MTTALLLSSFVLLFGMFLVMTELGARLSYRNNFGRAFSIRRSVAYPSEEYVETVPPPLFYRFKPGYHSRLVNINRFGLRGPEPAADGAKKRLLFIGGSEVFGTFLEDENKLWSQDLARLLHKNGCEGWEVINGGFPMYNSAHQLLFWAEALDQINPAAVVVSLGASDVTLAWLLGDEWEAGTPWPEILVRQSAPRTGFFRRIMDHLCLYYFVSMLLKEPSALSLRADEIDWEKCQDTILGAYRQLHTYAQQRGIPIAFTFAPPAYREEPDESEGKRLAGLQLDYHLRLEYEAPYYFALMNNLKNSLGPELNVPYWDLHSAMIANPARFDCYYDLSHWNPRGMSFIARILYQECHKLNWIA